MATYRYEKLYEGVDRDTVPPKGVIDIEVTDSGYGDNVKEYKMTIVSGSAYNFIDSTADWTGGPIASADVPISNIYTSAPTVLDVVAGHEDDEYQVPEGTYLYVRLDAGSNTPEFIMGYIYMHTPTEFLTYTIPVLPPAVKRSFWDGKDLLKTKHTVVVNTVELYITEVSNGAFLYQIEDSFAFSWAGGTLPSAYWPNYPVGIVTESNKYVAIEVDGTVHTEPMAELQKQKWRRSLDRSYSYFDSASHAGSLITYDDVTIQTDIKDFFELTLIDTLFSTVTGLVVNPLFKNFDNGRADDPVGTIYFKTSQEPYSKVRYSFYKLNTAGNTPAVADLFYIEHTENVDAIAGSFAYFIYGTLKGAGKLERSIALSIFMTSKGVMTSTEYLDLVTLQKGSSMSLFPIIPTGPRAEDLDIYKGYPTYNAPVVPSSYTYVRVGEFSGYTYFDTMQNESPTNSTYTSGDITMRTVSMTPSKTSGRNLDEHRLDVTPLYVPNRSTFTRTTGIAILLKYTSEPANTPENITTKVLRDIPVSSTGYLEDKSQYISTYDMQYTPKTANDNSISSLNQKDIVVENYLTWDKNHAAYPTLKNKLVAGDGAVLMTEDLGGTGYHTFYVPIHSRRGAEVLFMRGEGLAHSLQGEVNGYALTVDYAAVVVQLSTRMMFVNHTKPIFRYDIIRYEDNLAGNKNTTYGLIFKRHRNANFGNYTGSMSITYSYDKQVLSDNSLLVEDSEMRYRWDSDMQLSEIIGVVVTVILVAAAIICIIYTFGACGGLVWTFIGDVVGYGFVGIAISSLFAVGASAIIVKTTAIITSNFLPIVDSSHPMLTIGTGREKYTGGSIGEPGYAVPSPPTNVTAFGLAPSSLKIQWSEPENDGGQVVTSYKIYRETAFKKEIQNELQAIISGLPAGDAATWYLTAVNSVGESAKSTGVYVDLPDLKELTINTSGSTDSSTVCALTPTVTYYHNGTGDNPNDGDRIFTSSTGNAFSGGSKYYAILINGGNSYIKIDNNGNVMQSLGLCA